MVHAHVEETRNWEIDEQEEDVMQIQQREDQNLEGQGAGEQRKESELAVILSHGRECLQTGEIAIKTQEENARKLKLLGI